MKTTKIQKSTKAQTYISSLKCIKTALQPETVEVRYSPCSLNQMFSKQIILPNDVLICTLNCNIHLSWRECENMTVCQLSTYHCTICWAPGQLCSRSIRTFSSLKRKKTKTNNKVNQDFRYLFHLMNNIYLQHICGHRPFLGKDPWGKWCLRQQWLKVSSQAPVTAARWTPHQAASDSSEKHMKTHSVRNILLNGQLNGEASKSLDKLKVN